MFKNAIIYRIVSQWQAGAAVINEALSKTPFMPCGRTQEKSAGWVPPRGEENGLLLEAVGGQYIARFMTETKLLPASVLKTKTPQRWRRWPTTSKPAPAMAHRPVRRFNTKECRL